MNISSSSVGKTSSVSHSQQVSAYQATFVGSKALVQGTAHATAPDATAQATAFRTVNSLADLALQTSPSRQARIEALRAAVRSKQYQLDSAKTAAAMANAWV
jgi:anti-sigma28 factor (negative regulator of flagellin synthesis)